MNPLIFSQSAVFHLNQLSNLLSQHTGKRHRLSSTEGIISLMLAASQSKIPEIQSLYQQLINGLSKEQKQALILINKQSGSNSSRAQAR